MEMEEIKGIGGDVGWKWKRRLWGEVEKEDEGEGNVEMEKVVRIWRRLRRKKRSN
jgi:hypothetical protein